MKIRILKTATAGQIKKQFNAEYPYLKIEFLIIPALKSGSRHPAIVPDNVTLGSMQPHVLEGVIMVNEMMSVGELEQCFKNHLLDVQVFRQSENLWLETTMTDSWSLVKQNTHGKEISEFKYENPENSYLNGIVNNAG